MEEKVVPIRIFVELPFWLRMPDNFECNLPEIHDRPVIMMTHNNFYKYWVHEVRKDDSTVFYFGPKGDGHKNIPLGLWEKSRTVISFDFFDKEHCDWVSAIEKEDERALKIYIQKILIPYINIFLIEKYRAATYDQSVFEIQSFDVPTWYFQIKNNPSYKVSLCRYFSWNDIPVVMEMNKPETRRPYYLVTDPVDEFTKKETVLLPYEKEMLDAYNLKLRGNYKDALRRIVSAFEILFDQIIVDKKVEQGEERGSAYDDVCNVISWKKKKELYEKTIGKKVAETLSEELLSIYEKAREKRNYIVHRGELVQPHQKGEIRFLIDHTRFAINVIDSDKERVHKRDMLLLRSINEDFEFFD